MAPHRLAHMVVPRLVLLIIESGSSSQPNALFCFMTNSITLKGTLRGCGAIENPKKKFFLCVCPSIFYCFPRGGSMANVIFSGCWRSKHSWELLNRRASIHFLRGPPQSSVLLTIATPWPSLSGLVRMLWGTKPRKICHKLPRLNQTKSQIHVAVMWRSSLTCCVQIWCRLGKCHLEHYFLIIFCAFFFAPMK